ncbi:MAG: T9SS type A sorting domain-containing protein [Prolixibacteraceae bacterium]|nr:T9SS type A sorting domain-containing protein [Prolixibacteraceae bacterium]
MEAGESIKFKSGFKLCDGATFKMSVDPDDPTLKSSEVQELASPIILGNKYVETNDMFTVQAQPDDSNISWQIIGNNFEYQSRSDEFSIPDNLEDGQYTLFASISANGRIAASSKIIVVGNSKITQLRNELSNQKSSFILYPNPAKGIVTAGIKGFEGNLRFVVKNLLGKVVAVYDNVPVSNPEIDLSGLQKGFYFVDLVNNGNFVGIKKLIKR